MVPIRQLVRHGDRIQPTLVSLSRQFSTSQRAAAEGDTKPSRPAGPRAAPNRTPPNANSQRRPRPAKAIDARAFAASGNNGQPPRVIRSPRLQNSRGKQITGKKPDPKKGDRKARPRPRAAKDDSEDLNAGGIDKIEQEQIIKDRPTPVRYEPQEIDFSTLQQTWPSLPTSVHGRSSAILGKLSSLSSRYPNGYTSPHELGRRLLLGKTVLFYSEAEKAEALEEASRLSRARADVVSQRKGDLVEPRFVLFRPIGKRGTRRFLDTYALGKYPGLESDEDQPAVLGEILKNLRNNGTYETAGKRPEFLDKVQSLLSSGRAKPT